MLRGERDQNDMNYSREEIEEIPECSGGSEIKTISKGVVLLLLDTRMLRGERDQNMCGVNGLSSAQIPECSGGSEIKTGMITSL